MKRLTNSGKEIPTLIDNAEYWLQVYFKLKDYEDLEELGRLVKLPKKVEETEYRECVHTRTKCHHENYKCSECPLTDEFYTAINRCYEDAYASGCLAGMELGEFEAKAKLIDKWIKKEEKAKTKNLQEEND